MLTNVEGGNILQKSWKKNKTTCATVLVKVHSNGEVEVF